MKKITRIIIILIILKIFLKKIFQFKINLLCSDGELKQKSTLFLSYFKDLFCINSFKFSFFLLSNIINNNNFKII